MAARTQAIARIGERTARFTKAELMARLGNKVPFGPVYTSAEIAADPHFIAREMIVDLPGMPGRRVAGFRSS